MQWAAVRTHSSEMMVPPQKNMLSMKSATCQGYSWGVTSSPPTILVAFDCPQFGTAFVPLTAGGLGAATLLKDANGLALGLGVTVG